MSSIFNEFFNLGKDNRKVAEIEYLNEYNEETNQLKIIAKIYGLVQGVGFRYTTIHLAKDLGVNGFVRNESDGSVYVEASGEKEKIEKFITELAKGPSPSADVNKVTIEYDNSLPDYKGFGNQR